jgi:hypothetical protein
MIPDETDVIINHALSTKDNLSVAIKVGLAFHSLKARIISDFLRRLESEVLAELGNQWTGGVESEGWIGLWIRKRDLARRKTNRRRIGQYSREKCQFLGTQVWA